MIIDVYRFRLFDSAGATNKRNSVSKYSVINECSSFCKGPEREEVSARPWIFMRIRIFKRIYPFRRRLKVERSKMIMKFIETYEILENLTSNERIKSVGPVTNEACSRCAISVRVFHFVRMCAAFERKIMRCWGEKVPSGNSTHASHSSFGLRVCVSVRVRIYPFHSVLAHSYTVLSGVAWQDSPSNRVVNRWMFFRSCHVDPYRTAFA